ncbi:Iron-sulfur cluster assembly protein 1 [Spatholobus suberectus]|nr:Iron-sulfur cluster assembly protein 1 [Spatholobus suberectus]
MEMSLVGAPMCSDVMKLQIKVNEKTGKIVDARFKTFGCGTAIASSFIEAYSISNVSALFIRIYQPKLDQQNIQVGIEVEHIYQRTD